MSDENKVIESEELDQTDLEDEAEFEEAEGDESIGDDDFSDIDEEESEEPEFEDEPEGELDDALQNEDEAEGTKENTEAETGTDEAEILKHFNKASIPGTDEYTEMLVEHAKKVVTEKTGEEYDPFDPKHMALFNQACNKLDKYATDQFNQAYESKKGEVAAKVAYEKASQNIDKIINTPELASKFEAAIDSMPVKEFKALQAAAAKGDYSGFIAIANRVRGVKAKIDAVNNRNVSQPAPAPVERNKPKKIGKGAYYGGVADFLGV